MDPHPFDSTPSKIGISFSRRVCSLVGRERAQYEIKKVASSQWIGDCFPFSLSLLVNLSEDLAIDQDQDQREMRNLNSELRFAGDPPFDSPKTNSMGRD